MQRLVYAAHLSLRYRYIFIETPKAACSSMKLMLQRLEIGSRDWIRTGHYLHDRSFSPLLTPVQVESFATLRHHPSWVKFCVVRNPFTRVLSAYLDKIKRNKPQKRMVLDVLGRPETEAYDELGFDQFLRAVASQRIDEMDCHWMPQSHLLCVDSFGYDLVIRLEELKAGIERLGDLLGHNLTEYFSVHTEEATQAASKIREYFKDQGLVGLVRKIYASDFDAFGYCSMLPDTC
jgi:hypothetical protein